MPGRRTLVRERLEGLRAARARADAAEVEILLGAADYADLHQCFAGSLDELLGAGPGLDEATAMRAVPVAELAEVRIEAPAEFGAALGLSSGSAARLIADALQVRHRLPLTWAQVRAGGVQAWRARRIAQCTAGFPDDVVAAIDAAVADVAQKVGVVTLDHLLNAAMMRLHPDEHEMRQHEALDRRHATLRHDISDGGTARMDIAGDLVDLLDFDQALAEVAAALVEVLAGEGRVESLDVRRSMAVGVLADPETAADLLRGSDGADRGVGEPYRRPWSDDRPHPAEGPEPAAADHDEAHPPAPDDDYWPDDRDNGDAPPSPGTVTRPGSGPVHGPATLGQHLTQLLWPPGYLASCPREGSLGSRQTTPPPVPGSRAAPRRTPRRQLVLYVHLSAAALHGTDVVGRVETPGSGTGQPVHAAMVREWAGRTDTQIIVKPVIDLRHHHRTDAYETPDTTREHLVLRDGHCTFPYCNRTARACDADHVVPFDHRDPTAGGTTCPCNLAPLCRHHYNLKTHHQWTYTTLEPGVWHWTSPYGYHYLVDHRGTHDVTPPDRPDRGCREMVRPAGPA